MTQVDDTVWFETPMFFTPLDLGEDPSDRLRRMAAATSTLEDDERLNLVIQQELLVDRMRRGRVRYAASSVALLDDGGPPRLSVGQFTIMVDEVEVNDRTLDAIGTQMRAGGRAGVGFVDLPAGRALVVTERQQVYSGAALSGRPRHRVHVVHQVQLMLASPQRRHLAVLALATECINDTGFYLDLMGIIARTVSFRPPDPSIDGAASMISAALGPADPEAGG